MKTSLRKIIKNLAFVMVLFLGCNQIAGAQIFIPIQTKNNSMIFYVDNENEVTTMYYGEKLSEAVNYESILQSYNLSADYTGIYNSIYTPSGSKNLLEPAIDVTHADGNNSLDLRYVDHSLVKDSDDNISLVKITLEDPVYPFQVILNFKIFFEDDVIEQWSVISHKEKGNVTLHKFASANLYLKAKNFWLTQYHGEWAKEMQVEETKITHGIHVLDSKLGTRANLFQPPVFMISLDEPSGEEQGTVLYGTMEWSGNFRIDLELDPLDNLRIISGINNFSSEYSLSQNEKFETPKFLHLLSHNGKGEASRKLHNWARDHRIVNGSGTRLTLLNNWEATYFDFNEKKLFDLLKDTKELGVDLFLLDDGWFGNKYPRNNDDAGLGDWEANREKLPHGIPTLVKEAGRNGVKFGIWIEPEMVNPESELYENHPEWVIKQPERDEYYFRNQLVLDLSNPEVQHFILKVVDDLFTNNPDLAYIKWDANAVIYNAFSSHLTNQSHLYIKYVEGLYKILERIRKKYPDVPMMLCSGGGGRVDYAALKYFTEFWPSDNTNPLERIYMQWEYSYFYPAISVVNHVTQSGDQSIKYKIDVAMMGKLGFDIDIKDQNEKNLDFLKASVKNYDKFKEIVWYGDLYRLLDPKKNDVASLVYVTEDKTSAVMFNYLVSNRYDAETKLPVPVNGLDPDKKYKVTETNTFDPNKADDGTIYSGEFLTKVGINPKVKGYRSSVVLLFKEVK